MPNKNSENIKFSGCNLNYHKDKAGFPKNPSTIKSETPRPVSINGNRMTIIDMHAHCQLSNVWPLVEGREELKGENPYEG